MGIVLCLQAEIPLKILTGNSKISFAGSFALIVDCYDSVAAGVSGCRFANQQRVSAVGLRHNADAFAVWDYLFAIVGPEKLNKFNLTIRSTAFHLIKSYRIKGSRYVI